mmetsp:Transcript_33114/g.73013  ORF Transcript_33114/g.73013 Transcript_33114/m.73013 type:complete len:147 (-) Transcript_33114:426-866(-)
MVTRIVILLAALLTTTSAFAPLGSSSNSRSVIAFPMAADDENQQQQGGGGGGFFGAVNNFFEELDAFVDDATSRRLGNGAAFYGKRKSSFYGKDDTNKKVDRNVADNTEDYRGPAKAGYFQWMPDPETGEMKPVTRLKGRNLERKY